MQPRTPIRADIPLADKRLAEGVVGRFADPKTDEDRFYHLCFCLLVPASPFARTREVVERLRVWGLYRHMGRKIDPQEIKEVRFHRTKARRLEAAMRQWPDIRAVAARTRASSRGFRRMEEADREWLVRNVDGLGYKQASHFLRNSGATTLAILDRHVLGFMGMDKNKVPTGSKYLAVENDFREAAAKSGVSPAVLDAWIWMKASGTTPEAYDY